MALTTRAKVQTFLGLGSSDDSTLIDQLIPQADALVKAWVGYAIESATYTEYYRGTGTTDLRLRQVPVTSVTSIHLDSSGFWNAGGSAFAAATLLTAGTDYAPVLDASGVCTSGVIKRIGGGVWPGHFERTVGLLAFDHQPGRGNIKAIYVGGYSTVPYDIELASTLLVGKLRVAGKVGKGFAASSESFDGRSISRQLPSGNWLMSDEVRALLRPYRRMSP